MTGLIFVRLVRHGQKLAYIACRPQHQCSAEVKNTAVHQQRPPDNSLQQLNWLPLWSYKQCILMYKVNCGQASKYISDLVNTVAAMATRSGLRSESLLGFGLSLENKPFCMLYQQHGTELYMTFVHRPV